MKSYVTEFIGTFFLVLTIGLSILGGTPFAALAIGAVLMGMVYMGGHVSGAHYNPAVSIALVMRGALPSSQLVPYIGSQILGALAASMVVFAILGSTFAPAPGSGVAPVNALGIEILFTFALCLVIMNVAISKKTEGNAYYGLAIGFTVTAATYAGGPISGGAFNPAVGIGPVVVHALMSGGSFGDLWLYLVGPVLGAVIAVGVFNMQEN